MMQVNDHQRLAALIGEATAISDAMGHELTLFAQTRGLWPDNGKGFPDDQNRPTLNPLRLALDEIAAPLHQRTPVRNAFLTKPTADALVWHQAMQGEMRHPTRPLYHRIRLYCIFCIARLEIRKNRPSRRAYKQADCIR